MTSDHRVAGSSSAGCKSSLEADFQAIFTLFSLVLKALVGHLLDVFLVHACTDLTRKISDPRITSQVYVDSKSRVSVGLGHLLSPPANITPIGAEIEKERYPGWRRMRFEPNARYLDTRANQSQNRITGRPESEISLREKTNVAYRSIAMEQRTVGIVLGFQYAGQRPDPEEGRSVSLKVGGYQLRSSRQDEIPNAVDDSFLKRASGAFGFTLLKKVEHF
jgi:hypothetical protein